MKLIYRLNTFRKILKHFGFVRITGKDHVRGLINFKHEAKNWYAEIIDHGTFKICWVIGKGLPNSNNYPGGHVYSEKELLSELTKATK
jgi:hypothetical protein